jgi:hypothetical protein
MYGDVVTRGTLDKKRKLKFWETAQFEKLTHSVMKSFKMVYQPLKLHLVVLWIKIWLGKIYGLQWLAFSINLCYTGFW